jgi:TM2 domain-containing membrane protein YozV
MRVVSADGRGYTTKQKAPEPTGPIARPKLWTTMSYTLLALGGFLGLHRLYNGQPIIAFAQALFSVYIFLDFGTYVSFYLAILLVGWLIADAVAIPKWVESRASAFA